MSTSTLPETDGSTLESVLPPSPSPLPPLPSPPSLLLPPQDAPKKKASKSKKKEPTLTKRGPGTPFTVQETNDLRRFLRESQTIARACEKMAAAHPRRTAGTVRAYHSKNKDEFEDGLGSDAPYAPSWTSDEHSLLVKVLAGPVASLNSGFKAFSEKYSKRSVIAAAKYYQTNRLQLEAEIKAFQEEEPSSSSRSVRISYANESDSDNDSSTSEVRWGDEEAGDESSQPPLKRRKK
ncbi:hypothetical protein BDY24DRAFT_382933 [Mrakia frigida]|uniref:uncharacterized protein n=1 Tax=Mrakia frigida TaxID=29902 RepID=UPI003FCBFA8D